MREKQCPMPHAPEGYINSTHRNSPCPKYDFFNHLPTQIANDLKSGWIIKYRDGSEKKNLNSSLIAEERAFTGEANFAKFGIIKVGISRGTVYKAGLPQIGLIPDSIAKVAANEDTTTFIVNSSKVGTTEIGFLPTTMVAPDSISQISFPQNSTTKVNHEDGTLQIDITEVNTSHQSFTGVLNDNFGEISLSSGISSQQFFNNNSLSFDLHF
ncbi:MAG: hypothetical protein V7K92_07515 [Nostoc sp.]